MTATATPAWVKPVEFEVPGALDLDDVAVPGASVLETLVPLSDALAQVRALLAQVLSDGANQGVSMRDLAAVVEQANLLERAASAVTIAATAGYARREQHDHRDQRATMVESIRARGFVHEWTAQELGHLLRISSRTADGRVMSAADLVAVMPHTLAAISAGAIEAWQGEKILAFLREVGADDETIRAIDAYLAGRLATTDPSRLLALTRYALGRVRPDLLPERAKKAKERRAIEKWEVEPGLCEITARMPTHQAAAIWSAATTLARDYIREHPELSLDQARLDAFVDLALANVSVKTTLTLGIPVVTSAYARTGEAPVELRDPEAPPPGDEHPDFECHPDCDCTSEPTPATDTSEHPDARAHPDAGAHPDASKHPDAREQPDAGEQPGQSAPPRVPPSPPARVPEWAAHPDSLGEAFRPPPGCTPGERAWWLSGVHLPGIGYVPPDVLQTLITTFGTTISTALLDADRATLLGYVHRGYTPPRALRELVHARDGQCRFYGCTMPATRCDLDHATAHHPDATTAEHAGSTSAANLGALCRRHHRAKQHRAWTYLLDPDTGVTWWTNAITGAWRTTIPNIAIGGLDPAFADTDHPPLDPVDDRIRVNSGQATNSQVTGDALSPGASLHRARKKVPDPTIPPPPF